MRYHGFGRTRETEPGAYGLLAGLAVLLLGLLANASCAHASKLDPSPADVIDAHYDAAVEITALCLLPDGRQVAWFGSGVIVDATHILTAGHVAETEGLSCVFTAELSNGKTHLVRPLHVLASSETDLASMEIVSFVETFPAQPVRYGPVPAPGEKVCTATAYPRREYKCGQVMRSKGSQPGDIRIDFVVEPGNSGSALYNERGELVGIVVHTYRNRGNGQYITGGATSLAGHRKELGV